jgi:hypothetical protein
VTFAQLLGRSSVLRLMTAPMQRRLRGTAFAYSSLLILLAVFFDLFDLLFDLLLVGSP